MLAAPIAIGVGAAIGAFNGLLVTRTSTPSLIITLDSLMIFRGLAIALTSGFAFLIPSKERGTFTYWLLGGDTLVGFNTALMWLVLALLMLSAALLLMPWGNQGALRTVRCRAVFALTVSSSQPSFFAGRWRPLAARSRPESSARRIVCPWGNSADRQKRVSIGALAGVFVLSSIQSYLVVMAVAPQWLMVLLEIIVVGGVWGDRTLRQWTLRK
jgi:ribose transport system permease protein